MLTPATQRKRQDLLRFIERVLAPAPAVQAVLAVGSVASGLARPDSDIDAVVWIDPYDPYIAPAEFIWRPSDDSFRSIFSQEPERDEDVQLDLHRLDLAKWSRPDHPWPEGFLAELSGAWWAYRRTERVAELVAARTAYPEGLRRARLDEALVWLDQHLAEDDSLGRWERLGPLAAHSRLLAAWDWLAQALCAYHRRWRPWRNRELETLLALPWLPEGFEAHANKALAPSGEGFAAYQRRAKALQALYTAVCQRLIADGEYGEDIVGEAFIRSHDEPGRAWNMDAWREAHQRLHGAGLK